MKRILVTGALGQIGSELVQRLRVVYGAEAVIATDQRQAEETSGPFARVDVTDGDALFHAAKKYKVDTIMHLAALLSATAEAKPLIAWQVNMGGLMHALEVARELRCQLFLPSSIGVFGPSTPKNNTPQETLQRPTTMYGVSKVAGELLCDYYFQKYEVDTRGLRFPGLISHQTPPGGGTTDYAVEIYREALKRGQYTCYLEQGTQLDMMYMPDALDSIINLMEADPARLKHRNAYNISAMSVTPETIAAAIQQHLPHFSLQYNIDPVRQAIADSWPDALDSSAARTEWDFAPRYDLANMTSDMLEQLQKK